MPPKPVSKLSATMQNSIDTGIGLWLVPGSNPALFQRDHFIAYIYGAVHRLPEPHQEATMCFILDIPKYDRNSILFNQDDLARVLVILSKAQLTRDAFDSRQLPNLLANINDGNVPEMLDFQDIGINWASEIFVRQSHAKIEDVTGFVEKHRAIEAITELAVKELGDFRYALMNFENIWNMVDVLKQQQLDRDGLYLLIYFLALANRNSTIPPSLPLGIRNLMLEECDEILVNQTFWKILYIIDGAARLEPLSTPDRLHCQHPNVIRR
ncbi:hypothetical protein M422DRAFT_275914 [Sphaerobolus stellatus SS14]|uniref:Uncharacterized protein n=1 Tax=Sphaerobolus stellatus (strain SS14) TaxID=990650 RepID=A0A0C9UE91_SPHS4|nr:hypothetical protein M422DRAFT_275914 [Sphaerobolus stellatus SS14]